MTKGIVLTRTSDSNWYIKNTDFNDTAEKAIKWVISLVCDDNK